MQGNSRDESVIRDRAHRSRLVMYAAYPAWVSFSRWCTRQNNSHWPFTFVRPRNVKRSSRVL